MIDYSKYISKRTNELQPSGIRKFFDVAAEIEDVISLGVGEPDFVTPWNIRHAAIRSIQKGITQYSSNAGIPHLRELIAKYLKETTGVEYDSKTNIVVTVGASEAIDITLRALIDQGDEILVPEPSYVSYAPCISLCGGKAVGIHTKAENLFRIKPEEIESQITEKTKAIILPYPNNPTGGIMEKADLEAIAPIIEKYDLIVLSDEIYSELTYGSKHVSIASIGNMKDRTIVINGFSKAFAMTGWRIGYLAAPQGLTSAIIKIHQYMIMCAPTASQYAAVEALEDGFQDNFSIVEDMREQYNKRRNFLVKRLNEMGLECFEPNGAFYVFPSVKSTGLNGDEFANELLKDQKVAVVPGSAFGNACNDFVRISYAYSLQSLDKAMNRIEKFVNKLKK